MARARGPVRSACDSGRVDGALAAGPPSAGLASRAPSAWSSRFPASLPSAAACLIWSLGSFGKLAIRATLWGYVYVSLVSLQINSKGRGQAGIFHSTAAPPRRPGPWFWVATAAPTTLFLQEPPFNWFTSQPSLQTRLPPLPEIK